MFKEPKPEQQSRLLTPELAARDPEKYRARMLSLLKEKMGLSWHIHEKLLEKGVLDEQSITFDPTGWVGMYSQDRNRRGYWRIELGVQDIPASVSNAVLFQPERFRGDMSVLYRASHELSHAVIENRMLAPDYAQSRSKKLFDLVRFTREHDLGFSLLGNLAYYQDAGANTQTHEDLAELVNMYVIDQDYFREYLDFLSDPTREIERAQKGLATIDPAAVNLFEVQVRDTVSAFYNE